jgi:hypothetical protein
MQKKIAFLALTDSSFKKERLMKSFFNKKDSNIYNLYIHNKNPIKNKYFQNFCLPDEYKVETEWGKYSLVLATIRLMKYALKDLNNDKFILISDSHCPLYNMKDMCDKIYELYPKLSFSIQNIVDNEVSKRYKLIFNESINKNNILINQKSADFVSQWFIANRDDIEFFVEKEPKLRYLFEENKITLADEMYFALIANHFNKSWINKRHCYFDWWKKTDPELVKEGHREQPHTYCCVRNKFIKQLREQDFLFFRKIYKDTFLDENFLLK